MVAAPVGCTVPTTSLSSRLFRTSVLQFRGRILLQQILLVCRFNVSVKVRSNDGNKPAFASVIRWELYYSWPYKGEALVSDS